VVVAWVVLKRLLSPDSLQQIVVNSSLLGDMVTLLGLALPNQVAADSRQNLAENELKKLIAGRIQESRKAVEDYAVPADSGDYRLVVTQNDAKRLNAWVERGRERISSWNARGAAPDIARFVSSFYLFESDARYFEGFIRMTGNRYPIIYRDRNNREFPLHFEPGQEHRATVTLSLAGDLVQITRTVDEGAALSKTALYDGKILLDPLAGYLRPISDLTSWKLLESMEQDLYETAEDLIGNDGRPLSRELDNKISRLSNGLTVSRELFNAAAIRLPAEDAGNMIFVADGKRVSSAERELTTGLLEVFNAADEKELLVRPLVKVQHHDHQVILPWDSFWFLVPSMRSDLPASLRGRKRLGLLVQAAFALAQPMKQRERTELKRTLFSAIDFPSRMMRKAAQHFVDDLVGKCCRTLLLPLALPDGWLLCHDECAMHQRLVSILLGQFGLEFCQETFAPGTIKVTRTLFDRKLPELLAELAANGFGLQMGGRPVEKPVWEFSVDATRSSLDWFELRPEIRCDGELLTPDELRGLLDGNSVVQLHGRLLLLDEMSTQVLAMFGGSLPAKKAKKGASETVRVPRLQILDWLQMRKHGVKVRLSAEDLCVLESLLDFQQMPKPAVPAGLSAVLRHYQLDAWYWLAFLYRHRFGACLADDMGLGKTLQGITLLAGIISGALPSTAKQGSPHLVVAPPSLLFNWEAELNRFLPKARTVVYAGTGRSTEQFAAADVIITSYGIVQRDIDKLAETAFDVIIFDETQVVKNLQAATTNAVRKLKGSFVLALTGTPVENHLGEYYAIMDLCLPGLLGGYDEFNRQISKGGAAAIKRLIERTRPFVLRRTKQMIAAELPPKIETDIRLELSPKQKLLYQRTVEEVKGQVQEAYQTRAVAQARIIALTAILRLRQICLAPVLASPEASDHSPKLDFLVDQLAELRDEGHSSLVFSQFTAYLDLIEKGVKQAGLNCMRLDGSTPVPQRKKLVQGFQNSDEPTVFLISLKAGGKGLNLTRATYVFHMDPWWNPAVENQASDRAHRIGQTEQVTITRLIMRHTVEEKMMELKARKLELYKALLEDGTGGGGAGLTREDFEFLIG